MLFLMRGARALESLSSRTGHLLAWFTWAMVLLQSCVVALRHLFDSGSIALQESVIYLHGAAFMLGLAYALQTDAHVRVDVFYRRMDPKGKAWVNAVGFLLFLLPLCTLMLLGSWHFVLNSWSVLEESANAGGLPGVFLLKSLIPLAAITLGLAGSAQFLRALLQLMEVSSPASEAVAKPHLLKQVEEAEA
ncbi:TRAP transporter small permease subunit [Microbulbifer sp. THAF38]|uniref:TRAP transporter small permease subunit n=1 Tax=Microbulbifer sp. THAF38 TaxID=2587856 RepID=UPI00126918F1|nr:TRAP transporter small permease subunit [Microbulbifer sp. THAF38]QFT56997.1 Tripartite ATP-independent periplasmic transporter, DctQ component [Microbulbifer sp. THAF38]